MTKDETIAVIGGGIVGATTAFYLKKKGLNVTIYDESNGQATSAAAGIVSPWLSRRRNKTWYELVSKGAAFYRKLMHDLGEDPLHSSIYQQTGTLVFKQTDKRIKELYDIVEKRRELAPEIGELLILSPQEITAKFPLIHTTDRALFASGGARVDGALMTKKLIESAVADGATFFREKVQLSYGTETGYEIAAPSHIRHYDKVVLAVGAWLPQLLENVNFTADIRAQKGQLLRLHLEAETAEWPVVMPEGEKDIIPFADGTIVIGATHENDEGYDLTPVKEKLDVMLEEAILLAPGLKHASIKEIRVGTRAFTSTFTPFFGEIAESPGLFAASGLGSSGLTSGPLIGHTLAQLIAGEPADLPLEPYTTEKYIKRS